MKSLFAFAITFLFAAPVLADTSSCERDSQPAKSSRMETVPPNRTIVMHPDSTAMKDTMLPAFALKTPEFERAYQAVADSPVFIASFPCVCGCMRNRGHTSLLSCYRKPDGSWDHHATVCEECIDGALLIASWRAEHGWTFEEMRPLYEQKFHPEKWPMVVKSDSIREAR